MSLNNLKNAAARTHTYRNYKPQNHSFAMMAFCLIVSLCALSAKEANASSPLLSQEDFVYTPSEMLNFDIEAYLQANVPQLAGHAEVISHWSGRSSISPKIILTLIEHQSQSPNHAGSSEKLNATLTGLSKEETLSSRIKDIATRLADSYYKNLAESAAEPEMKSLAALLDQSPETSVDSNPKKKRLPAAL